MIGKGRAPGADVGFWSGPTLRCLRGHHSIVTENSAIAERKWPQQVKDNVNWNDASAEAMFAHGILNLLKTRH